MLPVFLRSRERFRTRETKVQVTQQQHDSQSEPSGRIPAVLFIRQAGGKGRRLKNAGLSGFQTQLRWPGT